MGLLSLCPPGSATHITHSEYTVNTGKIDGILLFTDMGGENNRAWFVIDEYDVARVINMYTLGFPLSYRQTIMLDLMLAGF